MKTKFENKIDWHLIICVFLIGASIFSIRANAISQWQINPIGDIELTVDSRAKIEVLSMNSNVIKWLKNNRSKLILYINEIPMKELKLQPVDSGKFIIDFAPDRKRLLLPLYEFYTPKKTLVISIGNEQEICKYLNPIETSIIFYEKVHSQILIGILLIISIVYWFLIGKFPGLIRNHSKECATKLVNRKKKQIRSFSLAKVQLAFWINVIVVIYLYQYFLNDGSIILTQTVFIVLGFGIGATGVGKLIDQRDRLKQKETDLIRHQDNESKGFWYDILSDNDGLSIHRFQKIVFHLIGGGIFIYESFRQLVIPDLSNGLLTLMGLSSFAYVGLKINENSTTTKTDQQKAYSKLKEEIHYTNLQIDSMHSAINSLTNSEKEVSKYRQKIEKLESELMGLHTQKTI